MKSGPLIRRSDRLERELRRLHRRREHLIRAYIDATIQRDRLKMSYVSKRLADTITAIEALVQIESELAVEPRTRQYVVSSMFLLQCFRDLTADANEQFFFISGAEVNGVCVLDQKIEFQHRRRTATGAEGEPAATHAALTRLERLGHRLLAHFHSHPGPGLGMTQPSGTDIRFQERLERGGFPTVAAIFSRDGFVRFFRIDQNLEITIHGNGVQNVAPNTFRITDNIL